MGLHEQGSGLELQARDDLVSLRWQIELDAVRGDGALKPTYLFRPFLSLSNEWWIKATGMSMAECLRQSGLVFAGTYFHAASLPGTAEPDGLADVSPQTQLGPTGAEGRNPRYGGSHQLQVKNESGVMAASWTIRWVWINMSADGRPGVLETPPNGLSVTQTPLQPEPRPPSMEAGMEVARFRWTPREAGVGGHVYFLAYLERCENTLVDLDIDETDYEFREVWYFHPSGTGDETHVRFEQLDDNLLFELCGKAGDRAMAKVRFAKRLAPGGTGFPTSS